jgi:hypothetical protein
MRAHPAPGISGQQRNDAADNRADGRDNQKHHAPALNAERALPAQ